MRFTILCFIFNLVTLVALADPPDWQVNPSDFSYQKNLNAQLYLNDELNDDDNNIIAAFVNDELRGVINGSSVGNTIYYFMTVYSSNPSTDTLSFKVYIASEDEVFDIEETLVFNEISTSTIYEFNSYLDIDQEISLNSVPEQSAVQGFDFDSIYLPDYLIQIDQDPIVWTYGGNTNLQIDVDNNWLKVTSNNPTWTGLETITITATEQTTNAYTAKVDIDFTVIPDYGPPNLMTVPSQKIGRNQNFRDFNLSEFLSPYEGASLAYGYFMTQTVGTDIPEGWSIKSKLYQYSMNVTTRVHYGGTDHAAGSDTLLAYINNEVAGIATPSIINGEILYFLTVYSNVNNVGVSFKLFDSSYSNLYEITNELNFQNGTENGTPDTPLTFNTAPLNAVVDGGGEVNIGIEKPGWIGAQEIAFIAYDTFQPLMNADTSYAMFEVVNEYAPEVSGIPDQYVELGTPFSSIQLDDFLIEYDGDLTSWSASGNMNLNISISGKSTATITSTDPNWTGEEVITFRAIDNTACALFTEQAVTFTIGTPNQPPEILMVPEQIIGVGDTFPYLDLEDYLSEPNGDAVTWDYYFKKQNLQTADPEWSINPGAFQYNMTMTASVSVRSDFPSAERHQLAAFHDGEIRGLATAQLFNGTWFFFLNVYSNQAQDSIYFEYYDPDQEAIYAIDDSIRFISQQQLGTVNDPFLLHAGFINPQPISSLLAPKIIDRDWLGSDTLYVIATEVGTYESYRDTAQIIFSIQASSPNLPVDLVAFTARKEEGTSILNWQVENPDNILAYEIQRATEATTFDWQAIGIKMHEAEKSYYQFTDEQPLFTNNYYRLKMIDHDGSFKYSNLVSLDYDSESYYQAKIYPNPAVSKDIHLEVISQEEAPLEIQIVDNNGQIKTRLKTITQGNREFFTFDVENYPPGTYFIRIKVSYTVKTLSFVIVRD